MLSCDAVADAPLAEMPAPSCVTEPVPLSSPGKWLRLSGS